jgi:hypothetical protein
MRRHFGPDGPEADRTSICIMSVFEVNNLMITRTESYWFEVLTVCGAGLRQTVSACGSAFGSPWLLFASRELSLASALYAASGRHRIAMGRTANFWRLAARPVVVMSAPTALRAALWLRARP